MFLSVYFNGVGLHILQRGIGSQIYLINAGFYSSTVQPDTWLGFGFQKFLGGWWLSSPSGSQPSSPPPCLG